MRGHVNKQQPIFVVVNLEEKVPADHPLRAIKSQADALLAAMRKDLAAAYCSDNGRPGIPPEQLLKAMLLRALYSISSEIQLMQAIDYNMLYRWFLDLPIDAKGGLQRQPRPLRAARAGPQVLRPHRGRSLPAGPGQQ